jgi:molybdenum cofactor cytidylyltransferase
MGEPKQLLPWGDSTVLATVVANLAAGGADPIICVVGHLAERMEAALRGSPGHVIRNPDYAEGEMLSSYQTGIRYLRAAALICTGTLLALGDQPHVPVPVIAAVVAQARQTPARIVIPSYRMRRGHPLYLPSALWDELLALPLADSLRTLMRRNDDAVVYVDVDSDAILRDLDTPADYAQLRDRT